MKLRGVSKHGLFDLVADNFHEIQSVVIERVDENLCARKLDKNGAEPTLRMFPWEHCSSVLR